VADPQDLLNVFGYLRGAGGGQAENRDLRKEVSHDAQKLKKESKLNLKTKINDILASLLMFDTFYVIVF
jgi:hypothetical protein